MIATTPTGCIVLQRRMVQFQFGDIGVGGAAHVNRYRFRRCRVLITDPDDDVSLSQCEVLCDVCNCSSLFSWLCEMMSIVSIVGRPGIIMLMSLLNKPVGQACRFARWHKQSLIYSGLADL
jgi:hypothetical protein